MNSPEAASGTMTANERKSALPVESDTLLDLYRMRHGFPSATPYYTHCDTEGAARRLV